MRLISYGINGLRSLSIRDDLPLKKINIILGRNSSGKSTFCRSFPLIRQSLDSTPRGPLLWWGDLVDFGNFSEALGEVNKHNSMGFSFSFFGSKKIEYLVRISSGSKGEYISSIRFCCAGSVLDGYFDEYGVCNGLKFNGVSLKFRSGDNIFTIKIKSSEFFPRIYFHEKGAQDDAAHFSYYAHYADGLKKEKADTDEDRVRFVVFLLSHIAQGAGVDSKSYMAKASSLSEIKDNPIAGSLNKEVMNSILGVMFYNRFCSDAESYIKDMYYVQPLRASAKRDYRNQNILLSHVGSKGENLPLFIFKHPRKDEFIKWVSDELGFEIHLSDEKENLQVKIRAKGESSYKNIADMGFGYSQMLPILTQLWFSRTDTNFDKNEEKLLVIEQPELHLHPAYQVKLADFFVGISNNKLHGRNTIGGDIKLIIETHSPHIVDRLGYLVAKGEVAEEDIAIFIFDKDGDETFIVSSSYDKSGALTDWPHGFFYGDR